MTCPICHNPAKPIIINGLQSRNYKGEAMYHCCGRIYPPFTLNPKGEPMKPGKRKVKK